MIATQFMTPDPMTATPDATIAEVWDLMRVLDSRHVPIVERGALVGIVSDRDLARIDVARILASAGAEALRQELASPIRHLMRTDLMTVDTDTDLTAVTTLLIEQKIGALPVVYPGTRELAGIISYVDVLKVVRTLAPAV